MNYNWKLTSAILVVLAIPFALAIHDDADRDAEAAAAELADRYGLDYDHDYDTDSYDTYDYGDQGTYGYEDIDAEMPEAMDGAFFDELFFTGAGDEPALSGTLEGLELGMTSAAASVWQGEHPIDDLCDECTAELIYDDDGTRLSGVSLTFPDDGTARRMFTSRWGDPGLTPSDYGSSQWIWLNPEQRLRLRLEESIGEAHVMLEEYAPMEELVQIDRKGLIIGGEHLIGKRADELETLLPPISHRDEYTVLAYLPPADHAIGMTSIRVALNQGKVETCSISLETQSAAGVIERISETLGRARDVSTYQDGSHLQWKGGKVQLTIDGPLLTISAH